MLPNRRPIISSHVGAIIFSTTLYCWNAVFVCEGSLFLTSSLQEFTTLTTIRGRQLGTWLTWTGVRTQAHISSGMMLKVRLRRSVHRMFFDVERSRGFRQVRWTTGRTLCHAQQSMLINNLHLRAMAKDRDLLMDNLPSTWFEALSTRIHNIRLFASYKLIRRHMSVVHCNVSCPFEHI